MSLRDKYAAAIQVAKSVGMQGGAEEANGRLQFKGTVTSEDDKNKIWDALKSVPTWKDELNAQIDVVCTGGGDLHRAVGRHAQQDREGPPG